MRKTMSLKKAAWLIAGAAMLGVSAPSLAQSAAAGPEEITVMGRYGTIDNAPSASQAVGYGDLDLSTEAGRRILRHRISLTARYLCGKLGENDTSTAVTPSCRDAATKDALNRVGTIEEHFAPRGTAWVSPPAWTAPYPADWDTRYPG